MALTRSGGQAAAMMARMAGLAARLAPVGVLTTGLGAPGGLAEGGSEELEALLIEPEPEFVDEGFQLGDPPQRGVELATQSRALRASGRRGGLLIAHKPER